MRSCHKLLLSLSTFVLLSTLSLSAFAATQKFTLDPTHSQVEISWNHFGFSNPGASFHVGEGTLVWDSEDPSQSSVTVTIPVASVQSQAPVLDKTLKKDYFEVAEYPNITFVSTAVRQVGDSDRYQVDGKLTVHGVTRPVTLDATLNKLGKHPMLQAPAIGFDAVTTIQRSEFGLDDYVPMVSDEVRIRITVEALEPEAFAAAKRQAQAKS